MFEKQIDVCLYEGVFPFNNKPPDAWFHGMCQSDFPLANHCLATAWCGVSCHRMVWWLLGRTEELSVKLNTSFLQTYCPCVEFNKELCLSPFPRWLNPSRNALLDSLTIFVYTWQFIPINSPILLFCRKRSELDSWEGKITQRKSSVKPSKQKLTSAGWFSL